MTKDVKFDAVDGAMNDRIDEANRAKYHGSPNLAAMIGARVQGQRRCVSTCAEQKRTASVCAGRQFVATSVVDVVPQRRRAAGR